MDPHQLHEAFSATLQADQATRRQAETHLRQLSSSPGFLGASLDIIAASEVDGGVRTAAAVYVKNRILKNWQKGQIDAGERPVVLDRLVPVLHACDHGVKQQLVPVLRVLVSSEFPNNWPGLLPATGTLLEADFGDDNGLNTLYTGLLCFAEIARKFRWTSNEDRSSQWDPIISQVFPHLLRVGQALIVQLASSQTHAAQALELRAECLKLVLKAYKFATYFDLPAPLQTPELHDAWGALHGAVTAMEPPAYAADPAVPEEEKTLLQVAKCYKWLVANEGRLFTRYASKSLLRHMSYPGFRERFVAQYVPHAVLAYLALVEQWCAGTRWVSRSTLFHILQFLSHCVAQKETWPLLKDCFEQLVAHLVYPLLCASDKDLETFETDPHEYIHATYDVYGDLDLPDAAALGLLVTLVDKRRKTTLAPVVSFAHAQLLALATDALHEAARKIDGALRLVGGILHYIAVPLSPYYSQLESFLGALVFPMLGSQHGFLRARALETAAKFADVELSDQVAAAVYAGILDGFDAPNACLPVDLQRALAVQAYMHAAQFRDALSAIIVPAMARLLELLNEIDLDAVLMVMQECVESFAEQLQPFGADLMAKLVEQFMRLAAEVAAADTDDAADDQAEKVMAAIGLLNTMITVLLLFETLADACGQLEEVFAPAIEYVLSNRIDDFLSEVGELMEHATFLRRAISPVMWRCFVLLSEAFSDGVAVMYSEELVPCVQNFALFGGDGFAQNPQYVERIFGIFRTIVDDDESVGYADAVLAFDLAQTLLLALHLHATQFVPEIVACVQSVARGAGRDPQHARNNAFDVGICNTLLAALVRDAAGTLSVLQDRGELVGFFERWFGLVPFLRRVYDLKLTALGVVSLALQEGAISSLLQLNSALVAQLGPTLATVLRALPAAVENFDKKRKSFNDADYVSLHAFEHEWDDEEEDETAEESAAATSASTSEYLDFLQQENFKLKSLGFLDEDDEQVVEDPLAPTPLDGFDVVDTVKTFAASLQESDQAAYAAIFGGLGAADQQVIIDAFEKSK